MSWWMTLTPVAALAIDSVAQLGVRPLQRSRIRLDRQARRKVILPMCQLLLADLIGSTIVLLLVVVSGATFVVNLRESAHVAEWVSWVILGALVPFSFARIVPTAATPPSLAGGISSEQVTVSIQSMAVGSDVMRKAALEALDLVIDDQREVSAVQSRILNYSAVLEWIESKWSHELASMFIGIVDSDKYNEATVKSLQTPAIREGLARIRAELTTIDRLQMDVAVKQYMCGVATELNLLRLDAVLSRLHELSRLQRSHV